jgi:hypothetical protein
MRDGVFGVIDSFWLTDHKRLPEQSGSRIVLLDGTPRFRTAARRPAFGLL